MILSGLLFYLEDTKAYSDAEDPAARTCTARLPPAATAESSSEIAITSIQTCNTHKECSKPDVAFMPTHLLDVSLSANLSSSNSRDMTERLLLVSSNKLAKVESYTALSYCWGMPGQQILTTKEKVTEFMERGIQLSILPKTIQDAVVITRRIGVQYLWVDALCIIQDDDEQRALEIAHMAEIYRNAHLTISAASGADVLEGIFGQREHWSGEGLAPIWLPWSAGKGSYDGTATGCLALYHNDLPVALQIQDPLHQRAWTLQETLLSRRLLVYGRRQVYFTCLSDAMEKEDVSTIGINRFRKPLAFNAEERKEANVGSWDNVVADYSARKMSVPGDKLTALASVSQRFGPSRDYLAGIWRQDLPSSLLWRPARGQYGCTQPAEWRAPSWSWTSVDGPVHTGRATTLSLIKTKTEKPKLEYKEATWSKVVEAKVVPLHDFSGFGPIKQATLVLESCITRVLLDLESSNLFSADGNAIGDTIDQDPIGIAELDTFTAKADLELVPRKETSSGVVPLVCSCIVLVEDKDKNTQESTAMYALGLILQPIDGEKYLRIGTFCSLPTTAAHFHVVDLQEWEFSPTYDYSAYIEEMEGEQIFHPNVYCKGVKCTRGSTPPGPIKGTRYWCSQCEYDYCGVCKGDMENHPFEVEGRHDWAHRYARFRFPVKESLFEDRPWDKFVKVESDPVARVERVHLV